MAVILGRLATAKVLLNAGANPNERDAQNIPLLIQAVDRDNKEMVELLLAKKAEVNSKDSDGDTALDEAIEKNNQEIADLLVRHGATN